MAEIGVEVIYTPWYSPEMNPDEYAFNKIRTLSKQKLFRDMMEVNQAVTILEMVDEIAQSDCLGFYRESNYLKCVNGHLCGLKFTFF